MRPVSVFVGVNVHDPEIADPFNEMILECALAASADVIVTGDKKHLLPLREFPGHRHPQPGGFLAFASLVTFRAQLLPGNKQSFTLSVEGGNGDGENIGFVGETSEIESGGGEHLLRAIITIRPEDNEDKIVFTTWPKDEL